MITPQTTIATGHVKITDPQTGEVLVEKMNAINYEAISVAMADSLADRGIGYIYSMAFGNGGSAVDPTGVITYLPPNVTSLNATLYNQTYQKVVDDNSAADLDPANNNLTVLHTSGNLYSDILVQCLLDYGEPAGQQAFDNSTNFNGEYVFDELGLKVWMGAGVEPMLISHLIFHPCQKSLNRQIQIDYTIRLQSATTVTA